MSILVCFESLEMKLGFFIFLRMKIFSEKRLFFTVSVFHVCCVALNEMFVMNESCVYTLKLV